ncbi:hypothetical protein M5K25_016435 [Dendrobium thyrsiflorum]|uniref:Uncharacterized protein n=1 Tax=Dendrobium thyrsiflorum TaxID=117978 RepID=A0ABD0UK84_DENTH
MKVEGTVVDDLAGSRGAVEIAGVASSAPSWLFDFASTTFPFCRIGSYDILIGSNNGSSLAVKVGRKSGSLPEEEGSLPLLKGWKEERFSAGGRRFSAFAERLEGRAVGRKSGSLPEEEGSLPLLKGWKEERFSVGGRRFSAFAERILGTSKPHSKLNPHFPSSEFGGFTGSGRSSERKGESYLHSNELASVVPPIKMSEPPIQQEPECRRRNEVDRQQRRRGWRSARAGRGRGEVEQRWRSRRSACKGESYLHCERTPIR